MVAEEEEEEFQDAPGEQDEHTGNPGKPIDVSVYALSCAIQRKTITLQGQLKGETVSILVDTGSSHSFINPAVVKKLAICTEASGPLVATIADGSTIVSHDLCKEVRWQIQQYTFKFDLRVLNIGGWDVILGVDWMYQFSPISFDFKTLKISLSTDDDQHVVLQGTLDSPSVKRMSGKDVRKFQSEVAASRSTCQVTPLSAELSTLPVEISELLSEFPDVFDTPKELPPNRSLDHAIPLKNDSQPFKSRPYRYPHSQKSEMENQVAEMLETGIARPSNSPFASPVLLVKKKDCTWRLCIDYRQLNAMTIKDKYPIPHIEELLAELFGSKYYSKLDLRSGYHQILVKTHDIHKTAFQTHHGHFDS